jgi:UDPglucose 6-dehydrogenase
MDVCVIGGAGYVGLVTSAGLAEIGHKVIGLDLNASVISELQTGILPIQENGLDDLVRRNIDADRISFTTDPITAIESSEMVFIAVGTPSAPDGGADLSAIIDVAEQIARHLTSYKIIVMKSTVPVGTVESVRAILSRDNEEGDDFDLVSNPEFLSEGRALQDFFYPDRIVLGSNSPAAAARVKELFKPIIDGTIRWNPEGAVDGERTSVPVVETDIASAQMIKYAANAFLATRISFVNEIASMCEKTGANISEVTHGLGFDPRIGHGYLKPGIGFGGPCLEKDLTALVALAESKGYEPTLLRSVLDRNERQMTDVVNKIRAQAGAPLYQKTIAVFGLSFKAGTNDVRNSLAMKIIDRLTGEGAIVKAFDPVSNDEAAALRPDLRYFDDPYLAVTAADVLAVFTDWPEFRELDFARVRSLMRVPRIVDGINLLDPEILEDLNFEHVRVGHR